MSLADDFKVVLRRTALLELARQSALYQPHSHDDAAAVLAQVADALDAEVILAADAGEDEVVAALLELRAAVIADLTERGASLTPVRTFTLPRPLPADVLANRFYRDAGRAEELIAASATVHPLFLPVRFQALAR